MYVCRPPGSLGGYVISTEDRTDPDTGWDCFPADQVINVVGDLKAVAKVGRWIRSAL